MVFTIFLSIMQSNGEPEINNFSENCDSEGVFLYLMNLQTPFKIIEFTIYQSNNSLTITKSIDESSSLIEELMDDGQKVSEGILFSCIISENQSFQIKNIGTFEGMSVNSIKQEVSQSLASEEISFNFSGNKLSSDDKESMPISSEFIIPQWIKSQGKWWASNSISDKEFVNAIEYLINAEIIIVPQDDSSDTTQTQKEIPDWIRKTVQWWSDDIISDQEMANALQFLIKIGVIEI